MAQVTSEPEAGAPIPSEEITVDVSAQVIGRSPWELFWRRFKKDRVAVFGLVMVTFMLLLAFFSPLLAKQFHDPNEVFLDRLDSFGIPTGPQSEFWFGVDTAGRDLMVRVAYGARTPLFIGVLAPEE